MEIAFRRKVDKWADGKSWHEAQSMIEGEFKGLTFKMFDLTREFRSRSPNNGPSTSYQKQSVVVVVVDLLQLIPQDDVARIHFSGILKIFAGAAIGLFGSFAVFIPIFFKFGKDYPFLVFRWPVVGMFCGLGGVFLPTRIGRKT